MMSLKKVFATMALATAAAGGIVMMDTKEQSAPFTCTTTQGDIYKGVMTEKGAFISGGQMHMRKGNDDLWRAENHLRSKVIPIKNATCSFDPK